MSQTSAMKLQLQQIGHTIQYARELEAAVRYLELMVGPPQRYMLGVPAYGKHAAFTEPFAENQLGIWVIA